MLNRLSYPHYGWSRNMHTKLLTAAEDAQRKANLMFIPHIVLFIGNAYHVRRYERGDEYHPNLCIVQQPQTLEQRSATNADYP